MHSDGKLALGAFVWAYVAHLKDERRRASQTTALIAVQQARASEIRLRVARRAGELQSRLANCRRTIYTE